LPKRSARPDPGLTTVYRTLEILEQMGGSGVHLTMAVVSRRSAEHDIISFAAAARND
jgi:Fe2+ or Zn2+ uptake regulation protein